DQRAALEQRAVQLEREGHEALKRERIYPGKARYFPDHMREILTRDADGVDIPTIVGLLRHALPHVSLKDRLGTLSMPLLLINGRFERNFQPMRTVAAQLLPSMEIVDLDGGH